MQQYEFFLTHSLEKVFPAQRPEEWRNGTITVLPGELPAVQLVAFKDHSTSPDYQLQAFSITVEGAPVAARLRSVELSPSDYPAYDRRDDNYLTTSPGLFPDLLLPLEQGRAAITRTPQNETATGRFVPLTQQYRAVWIDFPCMEKAAPGRYTVTVTARAEDEIGMHNGTTFTDAGAAKQVFENHFTLHVLDVPRPAQTLLHTEWFHADCLATYYGVEVFSEAHWQAIENYIALAGTELGVNMLLTPVFTPPLDTAVGHERPTVQLVDIEKTAGGYRFGYKKLERWCGLCKRYGITHIEVAHLFTQWGAVATPKIVAMVEGRQKRIFGWDVPATSAEYRAFLEAFLPSLKQALTGFGYDNAHTVYHISDEPFATQLDSYRAAKKQVADLLAGCTVMDALSDYEFYADGLVEHPVPANDHIAPFIEHKVPDLWVYYCCVQCVDVPNRFYAMPSARNRIMGVLMYLYDIKGFLHWGYNFYNSMYSLYPIDPYANTHSSYGFPSGDPYLVYPGKDGKPLASIRSQVQRSALDDLAALQLLESKAGREAVEKLLYEDTDGVITFTHYPTSAGYLLNLREKVGAAIQRYL